MARGVAGARRCFHDGVKSDLTDLDGFVVGVRARDRITGPGRPPLPRVMYRGLARALYGRHLLRFISMGSERP